MDEGVFHVRTDGGEPLYGDGPAERPDIRLTLDADTCIAVVDGSLALGHAVRDGRAKLETLPRDAPHETPAACARTASGVTRVAPPGGNPAGPNSVPIKAR